MNQGMQVMTNGLKTDLERLRDLLLSKVGELQNGLQAVQNSAMQTGDPLDPQIVGHVQNEVDGLEKKIQHLTLLLEEHKGETTQKIINIQQENAQQQLSFSMQLQSQEKQVQELQQAVAQLQLNQMNNKRIAREAMEVMDKSWTVQLHNFKE